jgi:S-adenosyl methyltransferase
MADITGTPPGLNPGMPNQARVYDYLLGGKDNYAVDRAAVDEVLIAVPDARRVARANRAFALRTVTVIAQAGVRQFIDLGTGIPTSPSVHEVARRTDPAVRVVYVDHDPVVQAHNEALLASDRRVATVLADIRRPEAVIGHREVQRLIDFTEPVGVLCAATLHLIRDEEDPGGIMARFRERMVPGSHLVVSHFAADSDAAATAQLHAVDAGTPVETYFRCREGIRGFFDGLELLDPGLVSVQEWRPEVTEAPTLLKIVGGVGRKA